MSRPNNMVILIGRLTKDPELKKSAGGVSYCRFSLAIDREKKAGSDTSAADFPSCVAWRQRADFLTCYGAKGDLFAISGEIQTGSYTDRDGKKIYTTDIVASSVKKLEPKKATSSGGTYPNMGTSVRKEDIQANDGFDLGDEHADIPDDDLPF